MITPDEIAANIARVRERIEAAARSAGRQGGQVRLVVVTKGHPLEVVRAAVEGGARLLGENYVEEAFSKMLALQGAPGVEWHMIGHVQSRKARPVAERFDCLHSLDSLKLAARLERFAGQAGRQLPVLLECNVSGEASKSGWPAWQEERWGLLAAELAPILEFPHLNILGLMSMAPFSPEAEQARPFFRRLARLSRFLSERLPQADWSELSMGMSADYEVAVQEGATLVRIGTAILGERPRK